MKSPREILFDRHGSARAELDGVRARALEGMRAAPVRHSRSIQETLWRELILPVRLAWMGLGAAWVVILVLRAFTGGEFGAPISAPSEPIPAESMFALQRQWMAAEKETAAEPASAPPKATDKRPRAALVSELKIA